MRNRSIICLLMFASALGVAQSDWIALDPHRAPHTPPMVTLLRDDPTEITLRIDLAGFSVEPGTVGEKAYHWIDLLTDAFTTEPGLPSIPYVARILAIPDQGDPRVEVIDAAPVRVFQGFVPPPARPVWKEGDPEPAYAENSGAYRSNNVYPKALVNIDPPGVLRDLRIARVSAHPIRYIAATNELHVVPSMTIRVTYEGGIGLNPKLSPRRPIAPSFGTVYRSSIFNYESVLNREYEGIESGRDVLLAIMPDSFVTQFLPYAAWRHKTGVYVHITKFSDIGANATNPDIIKNHITNAYNTWMYPPTHVLLVGDYGRFPIKLITAGGYTFANEQFFVEIEGNDHFPEMFIGRFTNQTNYRLNVLTSKAIRYEKNPYTVNSEWFKKGLCTSNRAYESQRETKRFVARVMIQDGGFTSVDTLMSDNPCTMNLTTIINTINNGRSFLNYRGEGWSNGWWATCYPFSTSDVSNVNNGQMLTFVTSIGCGVAMFNASGGNSFGEEWLELGTPTSPRGAIAFIGAVSNSKTTYNNRIDKGIYVGMFREGMEMPGQALLRGKLYMYNVFGNDPWVAYHYRVFALLGDPSVHIWKDVPRTITVSHPSTLPLGYSQSTITVAYQGTGQPVVNAQVCISGDTTFAVGFTNASGQITLSLTRETLGNLSIAVRGGSVIPYEGTIPIAQPTEHIGPYGDPGIVDLDGNYDGMLNPNERCQMTFTLKNWGSQQAQSVQATLAVADTSYVRVLTVTPQSFGNIASGGTHTGPPFEFFVKPECPIGYAIRLVLAISSSTSSWTYNLEVEVKGTKLVYRGYSVNDEGSLQYNGRIDPGETVQLFLTVGNTGEDVAPNVQGILRSSDPYIIIHDSIGTFGNISIGGQATNVINPFVVSALPSCPSQHNASFSVRLSTQNGLYPYSATRSLTIPIGQPMASDPTGPDPYGYYMYDSDDSLYSQAPIFDWMEIRQLGTLIPRNQIGDFTVTVTLPFQFKYYGINYTQLRISSDGWIAFGTGTQVAWANYPLPRNDAVNCMVAPFWDDLFSTNAADTGKLYYYYDAPNNRFIVEWDHVGHYSNYQDREAFQVILHDPLYYPTPTGDGEILFLYHTVNEPGSNTVGIEDHTQTVGLQYVYNDQYAVTASHITDHHAIKITTEPPTLAPREITLGIPLQAGWNLISNPVTRPLQTNTVGLLFPNSFFEYVFGFHSATGYVQHTSISNGLGYWGKFPDPEINNIRGRARNRDTINVSAGWNLVGSISTIVDTSTIVTVPAGIQSSAFFGFSGGYSVARELRPGHGYWVKFSAPGQVILSGWNLQRKGSLSEKTSSGAESLNSITISDAAGSAQTLSFGAATADILPMHWFELPPLPPEGSFDVRFLWGNSGYLVQTYGPSSGQPREFPIRVQSTAYPITVSWNIVDQEAHCILVEGSGASEKLFPLAGTGSIEVANPASNTFVLRVSGGTETPTEFALHQNYPNPFNPKTVIRYALPVTSFVSLKIYNLLGQEVATLVNEEMKAGSYEVTWDATGFASGVYFYRLRAGQGFVETRKLLLLR